MDIRKNQKAKANIGVLLDVETKEKFEKICNRHGRKVSEALREFVEYVVSTGEYPFKSEVIRRVILKEHANEKQSSSSKKKNVNDG